MGFIKDQIDLANTDTVDLIEELEHRGYVVDRRGARKMDTSLIDLYEAKQYNPQKFEELFSKYIWEKLGKNIVDN